MTTFKVANTPIAISDLLDVNDIPDKYLASLRAANIELSSLQVESSDEPSDSISFRDALNLPQLYIDLGNQRQHVGQLTSNALRLRLDQALQYLCPPNKPGASCNTKEVYNIPGIEYNAKGTKSNNAYLIVRVKGNEWPLLYNGLREAFIFLVASIFGRQSELMCYDVYLGNDKYNQKWCNVGQYVKITTKFAKKAHLDVGLRFNGDTTEGKFDCVGTIGATHQMVHWLDDWLSPALQLGQGILPPPEINCPNKEVTGGDMGALYLKEGKDNGLEDSTPSGPAPLEPWMFPEEPLP